MVAVRVRLACLAFALLWAQWLGLSHAIWHSPLWRGAEAHQASAAKQSLQSPTQAQAQAQASPSGGGLLAHDSDAQCRLFDQLAHSDALSTPDQNWAGPAPFNASVVHAPAPVLARRALAYSARAPPLFLS